MERFVLNQVDRTKLKTGMRVRTNYDYYQTGCSLEGTITAVGYSCFNLIDIVFIGGSKDGVRATSWTVNFDSACWVEIPSPKAAKVKVEFDSVVISKVKKDQILAAISQMDNNKLIFEKWGFGKIFEKGTAVALLFHGLPGTGKTLMGQAIADKMKQKLLVVGPAEIETSTPGGAERNIKRHFKIAAGQARPSTGETDKDGNPIEGEMEKHVLLFDECDSLITNRDNVGVIMRGQINTLLSELEHFDGIVIFTTNAIAQLDPAMQRRLTDTIEFEFPDQGLRKKIWERMIPKECPLDDDVDFEKLAEFPFAGGNIKNVVLNAARNAAYQGLDKITYSCFIDAMEKEFIATKQFEATQVAKTGRPHRSQVEYVQGQTGNIEIDKVKGDMVKEEGAADEAVTKRPKRKARS